MKNNNKNIFAITLSGIMIAISVIVKLFTPYFPVAGAMVLRLDFYGAFEKLPAILFGPVFGGIVASIIDFLGYFFANKTAIGYIPLLTVTAFFNCFMVAILWKRMKNTKASTVKVVYGILAGTTLVAGIYSFIVEKNGKPEAVYEFLEGMGEKVQYLPIGLIITGALAILLLVVNVIIEKKTSKDYLMENFFKLFIVLIIPGIITTILNTFILRLYIPVLANSAFMVFLLPRIGGQLMETLLETYVLGTILSISRPFLKKKDLI